MSKGADVRITMGFKYPDQTFVKIKACIAAVKTMKTQTLTQPSDLGVGEGITDDKALNAAIAKEIEKWLDPRNQPMVDAIILVNANTKRKKNMVAEPCDTDKNVFTNYSFYPINEIVAAEAGLLGNG
jgi:hypothetical protein